MHVFGFTEIFTVALSVSDSPIIILRNALKNVLDYPSFYTKSQEAVNARMGTEYMHNWCSNPDYLPTLRKFSEDLRNTRFRKSTHKSQWKNLTTRQGLGDILLHSFTRDISNRWTIFLCGANCPIGTPVLYQHLTDIIFKELLHEKYSVSANDSEKAGPIITMDEGNVLRYVAGYVCRHLRKKTEASNHPLKEDMVLCLMTMVKDKSETSSGPCEEWTDLVDQGDLWHVRENTQSLFCAWKKYVFCFHLCYTRQIKRKNCK